VLSALQERGTTIQIRGANELIRALFGITAWASRPDYSAQIA